MEVESGELKVQAWQTEAAEYVLSLSPGDKDVKNELEDVLEICDTKNRKFRHRKVELQIKELATKERSLPLTTHYHRVIKLSKTNWKTYLKYMTQKTKSSDTAKWSCRAKN